MAEQKKYNALFVDDEPNVIRAIRRMLFSQKKKWQFFFASHPNIALEILAKEHIDLIVTDMRMPDLDGADLLKKVVTDYPGTLRVILSGYSDETLVHRALAYTHRFLSKPSESAHILSMLDEMYELKQLLENIERPERLTDITSLPILKDSYETFLSIYEETGLSFATFEEYVLSEPVVALRLLQVANSSFFGSRVIITDWKSALQAIGKERLAAIIKSKDQFSFVKNDHKLISAYKQLKNKSILRAYLAAYLIQDNNRNSQEAYVAHTPALTMDIIDLLQISYDHLIDKNNNAEIDDDAPSQKKMECSVLLMKLMGVPERIIDLILCINTFSIEQMEKLTPSSAVCIANCFINADFCAEQHGKDITESDIWKKWHAKCNAWYNTIGKLLVPEINI